MLLGSWKQLIYTPSVKHVLSCRRRVLSTKEKFYVVFEISFWQIRKEQFVLSGDEEYKPSQKLKIHRHKPRKQVRSETNPWIFHECTKDPGCIKGLYVTNGREKLNRMRCGVPSSFTKLLHPYFRMNTCYAGCMSCPRMANQSKKGDRRCIQHSWYNSYVKQHQGKPPTDLGKWQEHHVTSQCIKQKTIFVNVRMLGNPSVTKKI